MPRMTSIYLLLLTFALAAPVTAQAWSARVQFVAGDAFISARSKAPRAARKGDELDTGDVITTGSRTTVQLVMADGSYVSLRPDTRMEIERYDAESGGTGGKILGLLRGGLRAITGHLQGMKNDSYMVRTPTAIIGVRGTDHEVFHVPPVRAGEKPVADPGTYDRVFEGRTFMRTKSGEIDLDQGQAGYARDAFSPPELLRIMPVVLAQRPVPPPARREQRNNPGSTGQSPRPMTTTNATQPAGPTAGPQPGTAPLPGPQPLMPPPIYPPRLPDGMPPADGAIYSAPAGSAMVGGDIFPDKLTGTYAAGSGGMTSIPLNGNKIILFSGSNNLYAVTTPGGFQYTYNAAPLIDQGSTFVGGVTVNWGIYAGGLKFDNFSGEVKPLAFHFAYAPLATPPSVMKSITGTVVFNTIMGFSKPVMENGQLGGSVNTFTASIDFSNVLLNTYAIGVTDAAGRNWTGTYTGTPIPLNTDGAFSTPLTVSCTACIGTPPGGNATTIVIGPTGGGVISSYDMHVGTSSVTGNVTAK